MRVGVSQPPASHPGPSVNNLPGIQLAVLASMRLPILGEVPRLMLANVCGLLLLPAGLGAQRLTGVVLDATNDRPVAVARLTVLDEEGGIVADGLSGPDGRFAIRLPKEGVYQLAVEGFGFYTSLSAGVTVERDASLSLMVRLMPNPVQVDSLVVTIAGSGKLEQVGFRAREKSGQGHFYGRKEIAKKQGSRGIPELLAGTTGVRVITVRGQERILFLASPTATDASWCSPTLYVDGVQYLPPWEKALRLDEIEALEVYTRPGQVPVRFSSNSRGCGVVVAWTR